MPYLELHDLTRRFGARAGLFELSLSLERGQILALLGPSGSGKTTTLRLLGGFEQPDSGQVVVDGEDVTRLRPEQRRFGMVFQHYALFPHLDVGANVAFGLESRGVARGEVARRVADSLALVDLTGFERRPVGGLSGGQQQRVALARALAPEPRVLLLDEPLSNLDPSLRERTRRELRALIRRIGITTVMVTHEQDDAFDLGDVVAVLKDGHLEQAGTPEALYRAPATAFVAGFIGRGSWLDGRVSGADAGITQVRIERAEWSFRASPASRLGEAVRVLVRPEGLVFGPEGTAGLAGTVTDRRFAGATAHFRVTTTQGNVIEVSAPAEAAVVGAAVTLVPQDSPADAQQLAHCFRAGPE
ncbi:MAG: ABC transporter ATP-binding protein [Gemmatimonadota bacterium]|nr:ABC transporter ATP-binding protein [Gemmatimonadota bacterium]